VVCIEGGVVGNVIFDCCVVMVNYCFVLSKDVVDVEKYLCELFIGYELVVIDVVGGVCLGLDWFMVCVFVEVIGVEF